MAWPVSDNGGRAYWWNLQERKVVRWGSEIIPARLTKCFSWDTIPPAEKENHLLKYFPGGYTSWCANIIFRIVLLFDKKAQHIPSIWRAFHQKWQNMMLIQFLFPQVVDGNTHHLRKNIFKTSPKWIQIGYFWGDASTTIWNHWWHFR